MANDGELKITIDPPEPDPTIEELRAIAAGENKEAEIIKVEDNTNKAAVDDLVTQYKTQAEQEKKDREAAERRHQADVTRLQAEAAEAKKQVNSSQLDTITTALSSAKAEAEAAKRDVTLAIQNGDAEAQAEALDRLAGAKALILRYDEAKVDLERIQKTPEARKVEPQNDDPVESYLRGRSDPTKRWLREHPDFITDQRKNSKLTAAHYDAVGEGIGPDTDAYFEHVEKYLGLKEKTPAKANGGDVTVKEHKRAAPRPSAAPVGGTVGGSASSDAGGEVRLTAREAAAATDGTLVWNWDDPQKRFKKGDPIGIQEMGRRKMHGMKNGLYDRTYETQ